MNSCSSWAAVKGRCLRAATPVFFLLFCLTKSSLCADPVPFAVLHSFDGASGITPLSGLVHGVDGNFYGTTESGGTANRGTIYKITPAGTLNTLYGLADGTLGKNPVAKLALGADGNFYGTASLGGGNSEVVSYKVTPAGFYSVVYAFMRGTGGHPMEGLTLGTDGNFYGVLPFGDASSGLVFQVTPAGAYADLHTLTGADGVMPSGDLALGPDGNF